MGLEQQLTPIAKQFCVDSAGRWDFGQYIAEGNSAAVFRIDGDEAPAALKIYDPIFFQGDEGKASLIRVEAHKPLIGHDCPYLIGITDAGAYKNTAFVLMEYLPWKELADKIDEIQPEEIWPIIEQLAEASQYLEKQDIYHRDIKPENIAISDDRTHLKLLDLGILRSTQNDDGAGSDDDGKRPFIGTVQYASPEYLLREEVPGPSGLIALTYYQIGGVLHDLITKKRLFEEDKAKRNKHILAMAVHQKIPEIHSDQVDNKIIVLARDCLEKDPDRRRQLVNWERFQQDQAVNAHLEASKLRYLEPEPSAPDTPATATAAFEAQRITLINIAKQLVPLVTQIANEQGLPPNKRSITEIDQSSVILDFTFVHRKNTPVPIEVGITFEVLTRAGYEQCMLNLDRRKYGRSILPIGSVTEKTCEQDLNISRPIISECLVEEYLAQIEAAIEHMGDKK